MMVEGVVLGLVAAGAATLAVVFWYFNTDNVTRRQLRAVPVRHLIEAGEAGAVRITGEVLNVGLTLDAPLSGRRCAWYGAYVDEWRSSGKSGHWAEVIREENCTEFLVRDGTGTARVRCVVPRVVSLRDFNTRSGTFDDATPAELALLTRHGHNATGMLGFNKAFRYREAAIEPGETVTILGKVRPKRERDAGFEIVPPDDGEMVMSDDPDEVK